MIVAFAVLGVIVVARVSPETTTIGRVAREFEASLLALPDRVQRLRAEAQQRLSSARAAFDTARVESERALVSQLQEAKERGSLPPV